MHQAILFLGTDSVELKNLAEQLTADFVSLPRLPESGNDSEPDTWLWSNELEQWREKNVRGSSYQKIIVAVWQTSHSKQVLVETDLSQWSRRCEAPLAWWAAALGCAQSQCSDNGTVVALVEMPAPLDSENWVAEVAAAEGAIALARSLARSEGGRGIRLNVVTTPSRITGSDDVVAPPPPLNSFPGCIDKEVIGAVRLLLQDDAGGLTGTVLNADCGRS